MLSATPLLFAAVALAGVVGARVLRHGARGSLDRTGQALAGLLVGLTGALAVLVPRIDIVEDGAEIWVGALVLGTLVAAFVIAWAWEGRG